MDCNFIAARDIDGDGKIDIVVAGRNSHYLKVYWNQSR